MKRATAFVMVLLLLAACEASPSSQPPGQSQGPGESQAPGASQPGTDGAGGGGGGDSLAAAAAAVADWCTLLPTDLVAQLVPDASEPLSEDFPERCTVSNDVQVVQITYGSGVNGEPEGGATTVAGLGENAWFAVGYPTDDRYLTVILGPDVNGMGEAALYVEVAGHDGVDHADDAVAIAQAVIAQLD
jgi:hypothetical protein